jgi:hypothetical protein
MGKLKISDTVRDLISSSQDSGVTDDKIAEQLNSMELWTPTGKAWTSSTVSYWRKQSGLPSRHRAGPSIAPDIRGMRETRRNAATTFIGDELRNKDLDNKTLAKRLNRAGIPTMTGRKWSPNNAATFRRRHVDGCVTPQPKEDGRIINDGTTLLGKIQGIGDDVRAAIDLMTELEERMGSVELQIFGKSMAK